MIKFLHLGDIHLGYRQYKLVERERDYFRAFCDVCEKAIEQQVDFVLVAGDLFNYRSISPQSFNEAVFVFNKLKQAGIPAIAIEGNHDFKEIGNFNNLKGSWFEALAQNQLIYFLYPQNEDAAFEALVQNKKYLGGGYIELECKGKTIRITGSKWHGFNAGATLHKYRDRIQEIKENSGKADFEIFMFHGGHESFLPVNRGGVSSSDFYCLQDVVDYVALGHIHEHYVIKDQNGKDLVFNPGSTEANSIAEVGIERGGLLTAINADNSFSYQLFKNYYQRKFIKLDPVDASKFLTLEELTQEAKQLAKSSLNGLHDQKPIVQINIVGNAKFEKSSEELNQLKETVEELGALHCLIKWDVEKTEKVYLKQNNNPQITRKEKERSILETILASDETISAEEFSNSMLRVKELVIDRQSDSKEVLQEIEAV